METRHNVEPRSPDRTVLGKPRTYPLSMNSEAFGASGWRPSPFLICSPNSEMFVDWHRPPRLKVEFHTVFRTVAPRHSSRGWDLGGGSK